MRCPVASVLLLAAASLSGGLALPAPGAEDPFGLTNKPTECNRMKQIICSRANWLSGNNLLRSWQVLPDEIGQDGDSREYSNRDEYFEDPWISDRWQFQNLQTGIRPNDDNDGGYDPSSFHSYEPGPVPGLMMIYLENKDVLIENNKAYFVYDFIMAATNPFDMKRMRLSCFDKYMRQTTSNDELPPDDNNIQENNIYEKDTEEETHDVFQKRQESETGQKEIPDNLIFNEEENGDVQKKLFSFWSRLQGLSPRGRSLPSRRHALVFYGPDGVRGGPLSAETRASHLRPPGQPLRWG